MSQGTSIVWGSRIGSWLVLAVGLLLVVFVIGTWTDALSRLFAPGLPSDPALANEATLAPDAFAGMAVVSAVIATVPLGAGLWGLWHVHRLLVERGLGRRVSIGTRLRNIGLSLMIVTVLIVGLSYGYSAMMGISERVPVLPSHIAIFCVGLVVMLLGVWRQRRAG